MYKNNTKIKAREDIWEHTIRTLTIDRDYSTIVTEKEIYLYWEHLKDRLNKEKILDLSNQELLCKRFLDYRKSTLKYTTAQNLKILLFCGPEPENDIEILLKHGVLEENIWAVELDKLGFSSALNILKHAYPGVKIFKTKIDHLFDVIKIKFDVVYLDYTAPFFSKDQKSYKSTIELFKNNIINDFGILITNYSEINSTDSNFDNCIETIKEYFNFQTFVHELNDEEGAFIESPYMNDDKFGDLVKEKYKEAYSSFLTHFHLYLAEIITPSINIFKNKSIKSLLFDEKTLGKFLERIKNPDVNSMDELFESEMWIIDPHLRWFEHFVNNIENLNSNLFGYLKSNKIDSYIGFVNLLKYISSNEEILNKETFGYLDNVQKNLIDPKGGLFCDIPILHLWVHLIVNQLGSPYHVNFKNHFRFKYVGKKREMYVDVFTLDKCRYFYNWLPSISSMPENMLDVAKQLLIRINIDIIRKTTQHYLIDESYQYGNLLCYNDKGVTFLDEIFLESRKIINSNNYEAKDKFIEMFETADYLAQKVANNYYKSFSSFNKFHMTYTAHTFVSLKIKKIPNEFKVFGKKFNKYKIDSNFNFRYHTYSKSLSYNTKYILNGSHRFDLMIIKTIKSVFDRYDFECEIIDRPD